jgi:DUF4097 and DUF4098 domain-containing protein YvlB
VLVVGVGLHRHSGDHVYPWSGFAFNSGSVDEFLGDKHESDQTADFALLPGGSLTLVNPHGDVTINGTSEDNSVHVTIHKQVYARTDADADSKARQLTPSPTTSGSGLTLTMPTMEGGRADLVITVPAATALSITANHGDIKVAGLQAPVRATANHGDIDLSGLTGPVTARINNGSSSLTARTLGDGITIEGHAQDLTLSEVKGAVNITGDFFGTTHLEHVNGMVQLHTSRADLHLARLDGQAELDHVDFTADRVLGPLVLHTHNGNVTLDRVAGDVTVTNNNGTIALTAAPMLGNISLEGRNGSIEITLPEKASFSAQATTTNGDASSDFALPANEHGQQKMLSGMVGSGGPTVRLSTTNGDISIHKGNVEAVPETLPAPQKFTLTPQGAAASAPGKKHKAAVPAATP